MTEAEWLTGEDPEKMLDFVEARHKAARTKVGRRKLRLFGTGCFRSYVEHEATRPHRAPEKADLQVLREAAELVERYADGLADKADLARMREKVRHVDGWGVADDLLADQPQKARVASRVYYS